MKSRTSFFKVTVLKKDITRFFPVWALYTVYLLCRIYTNTSIGHIGSTKNYDIYWLLSFDGFTVLLYAFLCATFLFGDLFKTRMCNALHAMPLRRETWFSTHVLAAVLFAIVPNTLAALVMMPFLKEYAPLAGMWWLAMNGSFVFFFGLAALSVMCAGNRLGHATVFCLIGFLPLLVYGIYALIYEPMLYGFSATSEPASTYSPALALNNDYFGWQTSSNIYRYTGLIAEDWITLAVCVVIGIGLLGAAMVLYRRRKLEWAGDFTPYTLLQWALLILGSFYAAILIPVAGFPIGFFLIRMLQERTVKVFHKKNWIRFGITTAAVLLTMGLTLLDPLGIVTRVPEAEDVESVEIGDKHFDGYAVLTDAQGIEAAIALHEYALEYREPGEDFYLLYLTYNMKNGSTLHRTYVIGDDAELLQTLKFHLGSFRTLFGTDDIQLFMDSAYYAEWQCMDWEKYDSLQWRFISPDEYSALLIHLMADCENGLLAQDPALHGYGSCSTLRIWYEGEEGRTSVDILVYEDSATYDYLN